MTTVRPRQARQEQARRLRPGQVAGRVALVTGGTRGIGAADCRRVVAEVIDQHGRVDILVNNAGITLDRTMAKMTDEEWDVFVVSGVRRPERP